MEAATRVVELDYAPRRVFVPYHARTQRWAVLVAHRRAGKTVACINDIVARALSLKLKPGWGPGRYAYVAPYLAQAKEVAWEYLKRFAGPAMGDKNESELWVELVNGARIRIHGTDNPNRLRGAYLDGVVLDEYADMRPSVWGAVIRPMLADREGWGTFIGTPKGRNEFHHIWDHAQADRRWFSAMLRASTTGILPQSELDEARGDMTPEQYEQEFECSFEAAIVGAYFGREIAQADREGRIREVPYEPLLPVHTAWDLGKGQNMAVWFWQMVAGEIRIIDHHQGAQNDSIPETVKAIERRPYNWGLDFVPHDARVPELGTGRTRVEVLTTLRRMPRVVVGHHVDDGINAAKITIPRCYFDREKCADGLEALRQYRADFDEKVNAFKNTPKHDWTSHSADAFRYLCMAWRELTADDAPKDPIAEMLKPKTFNDLMEELEHDERDRG